MAGQCYRRAGARVAQGEQATRCAILLDRDALEAHVASPLEVQHRTEAGAAVREAGRYGIAIGQNAILPHYLDCAGITTAANNAVLLTPVNITIGYEQ